MIIRNNYNLQADVASVFLLRSDGAALFQHRDNFNSIRHPGKWGVPGGKIESNEDVENGVIRELFEETSIKNIKILKEIDQMYEYELPENLVGIIWKGRFRGQKQKWFITKFLGTDDEINLNTKHQEFIEWKWIDPKKLPEVIVNFKKKLYINLLKEINAFID